MDPRPTYLDVFERQQKAAVIVDLHARALERAVRPALLRLLREMREDQIHHELGDAEYYNRVFRNANVD